MRLNNIICPRWLGYRRIVTVFMPARFVSAMTL